MSLEIRETQVALTDVLVSLPVTTWHIAIGGQDDPARVLVWAVGDFSQTRQYKVLVREVNAEITEAESKWVRQSRKATVVVGGTRYFVFIEQV